MTLRLIAAASILAISTTANAFPPKPARCPSVSAIHITKQDVKKPQGFDYWFVDLHQRFDTNNKWNLVLAQMYADDQDQAYQQVKTMMTTAKLGYGPVKSDVGKKVWVCAYNAGGYNMMATTEVTHAA